MQTNNPQGDIVPQSHSASSISLEALADLIGVLADQGEFDRLSAVSRLFLLEAQHGVLEALGHGS